MSFGELPTGWHWKPLSEVADVAGGLTKHAGLRSQARHEVPLVSVAAVQAKRIDVNRLSRIGLLESDSNVGTLLPGDVLVVEGNGSLAHIGRVALWENQVPGARHQNHIIRVRPRGVLPRFLLEWLSSPRGRDAIVREATSAAGLYTLSLSKVGRLPVPVPPMDVQRRIVAKLDAQLAQTRAAREQLEAVPALVEQYRQSVLAAAFRGDLTADWRKKNPDVEPASKLLERIRLQRRQKWEAAELAKMKAKGKLPKDDKWKSKYSPPRAVDSEGLPLLPSGWCWVAVEELTAPGRSIRYGIVKPGPDTPGGVPYVRVMEMKTGRIDVAALNRCAPARAAQFQGASLLAGDILVSKDGTIGKVAHVPPELEGGNITQHVLRVSPSARIDRWFLSRAIEAPHAQAWMSGQLRGVALQGVNVGDFQVMPVPLAPPDEQSVVAAAVNGILDQLQQIAARHSESLRQLAGLEQVFLANAFMAPAAE